MLDPISILTATGFGIQALEFLLGSGIKIYMTAKRSESCPLILNDYCRALADCETSMRKWGVVWHGFEDSTYIHFWGQSTFDQVQGLLSDIRATHASIVRRLCGQQEPAGESRHHRRKLSARLGISRSPSRNRSSESAEDKAKKKTPGSDIPPASTSDWEEWKRANHEARKDEPGKIPIQVRDPNLGRRIAFTLFKDELLKTEVDQLRDRVAQLEKITRDSFRELRGQESSEERPSRSQVTGSGDEFRRATNFAIFSNELHKAYRNLRHDCPWALELRIPNGSSDQLATERKYNLDLDFTLCLDGDPHGGLWRRVRIKYDSPVDAKAAARVLPGKMVTARAPRQSQRPADVMLLDQIDRRSKSFRPLLQEGRLVEPDTAKAWEEDRAALLLGLVDWVVLMWNSPWTSVPCCCGIRFAQLSSRSRQYGFAVDEHENCRGPHFADRKLLQLGLTIAELIVGTSITIPRKGCDSVSQVVLLEQWDSQSDPPMWVDLSRDGLIGQVEGIASCEKLAPVIEYCLDWPSLGASNMLDPDKKRQVMNNVVEPVRNHYNTVSEHREATRKFKWWRQQQNSAWPAHWLFESTLTSDSSGQHLMPGSFPA